MTAARWCYRIFIAINFLFFFSGDENRCIRFFLMFETFANKHCSRGKISKMISLISIKYSGMLAPISIYFLFNFIILFTPQQTIKHNKYLLFYFVKSLVFSLFVQNMKIKPIYQFCIAVAFSDLIQYKWKI